MVNHGSCQDAVVIGLQGRDFFKFWYKANKVAVEESTRSSNNQSELGASSRHASHTNPKVVTDFEGDCGPPGWSKGHPICPCDGRYPLYSSSGQRGVAGGWLQAKYVGKTSAQTGHATITFLMYFDGVPCPV
uniref:Uncharacterized protein n=1 Tax=Trichuris muris TaxID=70415 RepID=A0A5S6QSG3_TRIMR